MYVEDVDSLPGDNFLQFVAETPPTSLLKKERG
jgi:hypothetical protein